jgi:ribonuclease HI
MSMANDPYAIYVNCDGAMDYGSGNPGGIGFIIRFPDSIPFEPISETIGIYTGGNIERLEIEAIIQAMNKVINLFELQKDSLTNINHIIFITDRFGLCDTERTNPYKIRDWRKNSWKNFEGKPIKNHELLDKLDKARKKLSEKAYARINIEYRPRKQNRIADKLAKAGKKEGFINGSLSKKGEKIGKRKFDGQEISYNKLIMKEYLNLHVFRKDPVQEEWEVWGELCNGDNKGQKLKIYADNQLATKLKRGNNYLVRVKNIFTHHIHIYRIVKHIPKSKPKETLQLIEKLNSSD